jgi:sugar (pentulose or hexulose) kinase
MPVHLPAEGEACVLGSALVAAVHAGRYATFDEAAKAMVRVTEVVEPNPSNRQAYDDAYGRYLATYPALKPLMHGLASQA